MKTIPEALAFPVPVTFDKDNDSYGGATGLTKREYFAAIIMAGFSANPNMESSDANARGAVYAADALIKALNENK